MSNTEASRTYEAIVEAVINEVREDFESAGIDEQTLQDLKRNWQIKLSETKVTEFTWDSAYNDRDNANQPTVAPVASEPLTLTNTNTTSAEGVTSEENNSNNNNNSNDNVSTTTAKATEPTTVKSENGNEQELTMPLFEGNNNQPVVKEENDDNENNGTEKTLPPPLTTESNNNNNNNNNNNDDDDDDQDDINNSDSQDKDTEQTNKSTEIELEIDDPNGNAANQVRLQAKKAKRSALLDTDEVGSELDDSDDDYLISEGEDDGPDENLMLCLYDKVTRTKARWKCSLKDGVVTIDHKDYTFQKAQVEAEWV
ncbi:similar to Saccharomyces cerevisiae YOR194C TOA1 TFIIA large subunit [Maudiozyma saulgeensis]|uniref:Transcription initiation factor IIA large subunit n=1 Tax=Maudiozyma saulgeensis TaxID=1789683 RepID=A0A1X7R9M3_9SACH|nr:similar to Saccharomyces cerevisiae YOR194C TOA1 TFIIA large subunit [Kazachstania saulgeensis]